MDPVSMGLMAAGSLVKGVAGYRSGQANKAAYEADAISQEEAGNAQALQVRDEARQTIGNQVAAQFGNGFQGGSGSALDALTQSQINATLDMMQVRRTAQSKAIADQAAGANAERQGDSSLLTGAIGAGAGAYRGMTDWAAAKKGMVQPVNADAFMSSALSSDDY